MAWSAKQCLFLSLGLLFGGVQGVSAQVNSDIVGALTRTVAVEWGVPSDALVVEVADLDIPVGFQCCADVRIGGSFGSWRTAVIRSAASSRSLTARFRAGVRRPRVVAGRTLAAGDTVRAEDMLIEDRVVWGRPEEGTEPKAGWVVRSGVRAGSEIRYPWVVPPPVVNAGEEVRVLIRNGAAEVSLSGTAIGSAPAGGAIQVRLAGGRGVVRAIATASQVVVVSGSLPSHSAPIQ